MKIKAQLFILAAEILPADKLKRLHAFCETLHGYDEWGEIKLQRRHSLGQTAMMYYSMSKSREPTDLGWSRLSGFQYDLEGAARETHILAHAQSLLPDNIRHQFDLDAELMRQKFFRGCRAQLSHSRVGADTERASQSEASLVECQRPRQDLKYINQEDKCTPKNSPLLQEGRMRYARTETFAPPNLSKGTPVGPECRRKKRVSV